MLVMKTLTVRENLVYSESGKQPKIDIFKIQFTITYGEVIIFKSCNNLFFELSNIIQLCFKCTTNIPIRRILTTQ